MIYNIAVEFREWITQKYVEWRGNAVGRERTVKDFAAWLGVSQPTMVQWMAGKKTPKSHQSIKALVAQYGDETFSALQMPIPGKDDYLQLAPMTTDEAITAILRLAQEHGLQVEIHRRDQD